jgi:transcriptional regulator with XRE-family HTH domain
MNAVSNRASLGAALRSLRKQHNWTLQEVSRRTGFSVPTLSKVENDRISLSYDKLIRLSEGLEVDISQLFAPTGSVSTPAITGRRSINRRSEGQLVPTRNYDYRYLSTDVVQKKLIPIIAEPRARSLDEFGELVKHSGEEFIFVLEGEVEVHTGLYAPYALAAGESTYLDSSMGHAFIAKGSAPCRLLAVCSASESHLRETMEKLIAPPRAGAPAGRARRRTEPRRNR